MDEKPESAYVAKVNDRYPKAVDEIQLVPNSCYKYVYSRRQPHQEPSNRNGGTSINPVKIEDGQYLGKFINITNDSGKIIAQNYHTLNGGIGYGINFENKQIPVGQYVGDSFAPSFLQVDCEQDANIDSTGGRRRKSKRKSNRRSRKNRSNKNRKNKH